MKYLAIPFIISLTACASIVGKNTYPVTVSSTPQGAQFVITNRRGQSVSAGSTPQVVTLRASAGYFKAERYIIAMTKDGLEEKRFELSSSIDGWYFGNLLLGGLVGMLIVDPVTGSMFKLPKRVDVSINDSVGINQSQPDELLITTIDSLTAEQKMMLVKIE